MLQQVRVGGARTTKNGDFSCKRRLQPHQAAAWACRCRLAATGVNVEAERAGGRGDARVTPELASLRMPMGIVVRATSAGCARVVTTSW